MILLSSTFKLLISHTILSLPFSGSLFEPENTFLTITLILSKALLNSSSVLSLFISNVGSIKISSINENSLPTFSTILIAV